MLKKKLIRYFFLFAVLSTAKYGRAQEEYTLQSLIDRVLSENYQVRIQKNQEQISVNNNTLGNAGFLPVVDAQANANVSFYNTKQQLSSGEINEGTNAKSDYLNGLIIVNWTVFDGFRMFAKKQQLELIEQLGVVDTRYFIEQTIADITIAYYQMVQEIELLSNYKNSLNISRFRYELEKKKISVGSGNVLLFNQALVDYNNDSLTVLEIDNLIRSLEIQISRFANLDPIQQLKIANDSIDLSLIENRDSLIGQALSANQEIKRSMLEEMIADKNVEIQKSDYYPVVNLFGQYSYSQQSNEVGFIRQNNTIGPQFGISVRFNLFNGGNDRREVVNDEIIQLNSTLNKENIVDLITASVVEKYYQYTSLTKQLTLAKENILAADHTLRIAKVQLENGTINGYDFRQTQLSLIHAHIMVIQLEFRLKNIEVQLNRLTGDLLATYL